ncbi:aromatic acid exporter family protein [Halobacillus halophilus]|uniref:aromatic acid exporter family protein n=1 Tax=Halobacillus halophilus TaxID=1570 RepID=UPI001CD1C7D4|nr:aromatic acid exporter family protein [Halobacillus halophilus]MCA1009612.1 aromatic acid exporter family protein [Halobacillus halophilus]
MKIGYRTIKTALGTPIAIWIAQLLQLENFVSAGILTILCIQITRKRSFLTSWYRFSACLIAMGFSYIFFEILIGYNPIAIGLMLFAFIPVTVRLKLTQGIVTSSVIILHLYISGDIGWNIILNEIILIIVGIGTALLLNLYMPSLENKLEDYQKRVEENFRVILKEISTYLREGRDSWTGKEMAETEEILEKATSLAFRDVENHLLRIHNRHYHYFHMRTKQFDLLQRMLPLVSRITPPSKHGGRIADFFDDLAEAVHPGNTAVLFLHQLNDMKEEFREDELPETREEFEARASLFHLLHEIEQYLIFKSSF